MGLSGSSAIIVAAFRALLKFYGLTIADLRIPISGIDVNRNRCMYVCMYVFQLNILVPFHPRLCMCVYMMLCSPLEFPQVILDVERVELGIAAGLQDRVIQVYGGLVHMDFSTLTAPVYTPLSTALLPKMYLTYDTITGSSTAH